MAMVVLDDISLYRRIHSPSQVAWTEGRRSLGTVLHSSNVPSKLSQLRCGHDDSTISTSIVLGIIIIIIIIIILPSVVKFPRCKN